MLVSILRSNNRCNVHRLGYARMLSGRSNAFLRIIGLVLLVTGTREEINLLTLIAIGPPALCHVDLVTDQKVVFLIIIDDHPINQFIRRNKQESEGSWGAQSELIIFPAFFFSNRGESANHPPTSH